MGKAGDKKLMEMGERVREIRKRRGYQQERLAELLGVSWITICRIENGLTTMNVLLLTSMAEVLGVSELEILHGKTAVVRGV